MLIFLSSLLQLRLWQLAWHWGRPAVHCRQDCRNNYRLISCSRISHAGTCVKRNYCDIAMTEKDALWISFRCTRRVFCFKQCLGFCVLGLKIDSICSFAFFHFVSGRRLHLASQRVFDSGRRLQLTSPARFPFSVPQCQRIAVSACVVRHRRLFDQDPANRIWIKKTYGKRYGWVGVSVNTRKQGKNISKQSKKNWRGAASVISLLSRHQQRSAWMNTTVTTHCFGRQGAQ